MNLALKRIREVSLANKIILALGMAVLTGILAQVRLFLPWTPVPVTCQTFAVLLAGIVLGKYWGGISQVIYVSLGIAGIPWFNGATGGYAVIMGPTGGYLLGFVLAALFVGHVTDTYSWSKGFYQMLGIMMFANFILIYLPGIIQLNIWFSLFKGSSLNITQLVYAGVMPFVAGDAIKIVSAALIAKAIIPK
ncbi:MAG: biotin transporter BioY [Candidatus Omnitrophica bacterium]|nr:biotin transporter BioY [Candidatus Omnitrophota bacterium]